VESKVCLTSQNDQMQMYNRHKITVVSSNVSIHVNTTSQN